VAYYFDGRNTFEMSPEDAIVMLETALNDAERAENYFQRIVSWVRQYGVRRTYSSTERYPEMELRAAIHDLRVVLGAMPITHCNSHPDLQTWWDKKKAVLTQTDHLTMTAEERDAYARKHELTDSCDEAMLKGEQKRAPSSTDAKPDTGVACKFTRGGRCYRTRCNEVLCCEAEEQSARSAR
jgi:hypothetical protein